MSRRVYISEDEYVDLPPAVVAAIDRSPVVRPYYSAADRRRDSPVKAFANPRAKGYGSDHDTPWPFDHRRAYRDSRYRTGIRNAINSDWTASNWKYHAREALRIIEQDLNITSEMLE